MGECLEKGEMMSGVDDFLKSSDELLARYPDPAKDGPEVKVIRRANALLKKQKEEKDERRTDK